MSKEMERGLITDLIFMYAEQIGLELETTDVDEIYSVYENKKQINHDIQTILFESLFSLQELRVEKKMSSLVPA